MRRHLHRVLPMLLGLVLLPLTLSASAGSTTDTYRNPLEPRVPSGGSVDSCADPTVIRGQTPGDRFWYMYCTTDPLNDGDTAGSGEIKFHPIPTMRSRDLVHWTYVGDALPDPPSWAADGAGIWAPDVVYSKAFDQYYMTFVVTDTDASVSGVDGCDSDNAIGVATSDSPLGPWKTSETPVVAPRQNGDTCNFFWTFDPDVLGNSIGANGILYYGSYYGGMYGKDVKFNPDGMTTTGPETQVAIPNRYEGANVVRRGNWYYLFASAANCCNGPITGYSVFAGRSMNPLGPFVDREGNSFLDSRVGGTPVVSMNGNRWTGTGHNSVFRDFDGQWWTVYHAINRFDPYFESEPGFTKRPVLIDPVDWVDGWPSVRAGRWASTQRMPAPAAQPGEHTTYRPDLVTPLRPGKRLDRFSDDFDGSQLKPRWSWVRKPADSTSYGVAGGSFRFDTQAADLTKTQETNASVLVEATPDRGNYVVQTRVHLNVPKDGDTFNFVQAGLVLYDNVDKFLKLAHVAIYETRQTEFAKEVAHAVEPEHRYGNTVVGPPANWTHLRVVKRTVRRDGRDLELYTAFTSQGGGQWVRGGTWTHHLGGDARIGLVSMGGDGYRAKFDYVRVSALAGR